MMVAHSKNRVIGKDNQLIWSLPRDLQYFKQKTVGKVVVMGRCTYDSIGRPLPGRDNIVMTRQKGVNLGEDVRVLHSIEEVIKTYKEEYKGKKEMIIIGGETLYRQFLDEVDTVYVTYLNHYMEGDTWFPEMDKKEWKKVKQVQGIRDKQNDYDYEFREYKRVGKEF